MPIKKPSPGQILLVVHPDGEADEHYVDRVQGQYIFCAGQKFHYLDDRTSSQAWEVNNIGFISQEKQTDNS